MILKNSVKTTYNYMKIYSYRDIKNCLFVCYGGTKEKNVGSQNRIEKVCDRDHTKQPRLEGIQVYGSHVEAPFEQGGVKARNATL